jgi:CubicO group peptidase (beta-lactamase class C family)
MQNILSRRHRPFLSMGMYLFLIIIFFFTACSTPNRQTAVPSTPIAASSTSIVPSTPIAVSSTSIIEIDHFISTQTQSGQFSGTVLISQSDNILLAKGYGWADYGQHLLNAPQTRFRIASVSKQFTAMAILLLQEQGKLHVQDPICRYIEACPPAWQPITIHQLLTHSSGIPDYYDAFDNGQPFTRDQLIAWFKTKPLDFAPGARYSYSNSGYILLGYMIEKVSGQPYATFLQQNIFDPLQMRDTGYADNQQSPPDYATGYQQQSVKAVPDYITPGLADGELYSTIGDLSRWDQALFNQTFASASILHDMFTQQVSWGCDGSSTTQLCHGGPSGYGYGWFIFFKDNGIQRHVIDHTGEMHGFITDNLYYPDQKLTIIILSNLGTVNRHTIEDKIEQLLLPNH